VFTFALSFPPPRRALELTSSVELLADLLHGLLVYSDRSDPPQGRQHNAHPAHLSIDRPPPSLPSLPLSSIISRRPKRTPFDPIPYRSLVLFLDTNRLSQDSCATLKRRVASWKKEGPKEQRDDVRLYELKKTKMGSNTILSCLVWYRSWMRCSKWS
jgi:hypothetical protein